MGARFGVGGSRERRRELGECSGGCRRPARGVFRVGTVRLTNLTAFVESRQIFGGDSGSGICAGLHDARIERAWTASQSVQRESRGDVRGIHEKRRLQEARG